MQDLGYSEGLLGVAELRLGNIEKAEAAVHRALEISADTRLFLPCLAAISCTALVKCAQGDVTTALALHTLARQHGHVGNSQWFQDVIGRHIDAAAESLSSEEVEAALARGREMELHATVLELLGR